MSRLFVVTDEGTTGPSLFLYSVGGDGFTLLRSGRVQAEGTATFTIQAEGDISADGKYAVVPHEEIDPGNFVFSVFDLTTQGDIPLIDRGAGVDGAGGARTARMSDDGSRIVIAHFAAWAQFYDFDGSALSLHARRRITEIGTDFYHSDITADGTKAFVGFNGLLYLSEDIDPDLELTRLQFLDDSGYGVLRASPDGQWLASNRAGELAIFRIGEFSITQVAITNSSPNVAELSWNAESTRIYAAGSAWGWNPDALTLTQTKSYNGLRAAVVNTSEQLLVTLGFNPGGLPSSIDTNNTLTLFNNDSGEQIDQIVTVESIAWIQFIDDSGEKPIAGPEIIEAFSRFGDGLEWVGFQAFDATIGDEGGWESYDYPGDFDAGLSISSVSPTSVTTGTTITITMTGAVDPVAVRVGRKDATNETVVSPTEVTADVPAGSGTQDVTVFVGNSAVTLEDAVTYT